MGPSPTVARAKADAERFDLSSEMKAFIDRVIVPALVDRFLAERERDRQMPTPVARFPWPPPVA
jgi:hypothetical protein